MSDYSSQKYCLSLNIVSKYFTKYSAVNCLWYYNKEEAVGNNSNSATKW